MKKPFIPHDLPPKIDYTKIVRLIGKAHDAVSKLNGLLINLQNPSLLATSLLTKEAVFSSRIEGTRATLEDVFQYEADKKESENNEMEKDIREIINYRKALNFAVWTTKKKPIDEISIKKVHAILLNSVRGGSKTPGDWRTNQVFIGRPGSKIEEAIFVPPKFQQVPRLMTNWIKYYNSSVEADSLVQIGILHCQFETIHPFRDGNGRIGRLFIPLFLFQNNLLRFPVLYVSEYLENHRQEYYELLNHMRDGHSEDWLKFFLEALTVQSLEVQATVIKIILLYQELKEEMVRINSSYAFKLLDIIFSTPIISFSSVREKLAPAQVQTIYNLIDKFCEFNILRKTNVKKRGQSYEFSRLIQILNKVS